MIGSTASGAVTAPTAAEEAVQTCPIPSDTKFKSVMKKIGLTGFVFFLVKGLLWLIIPTLWVWLR